MSRTCSSSSGRETGERDLDGLYPEGSFNAAVQQALLHNVERLKAVRSPASLAPRATAPMS
jgi:hypothetical protein